jgi:hypothetical protein
MQDCVPGPATHGSSGGASLMLCYYGRPGRESKKGFFDVANAANPQCAFSKGRTIPKFAPAAI